MNRKSKRKQIILRRNPIMTYEIFESQHFSLKSFTVLTAIIAILFLPYQNLVYLFIGFIIYLSLTPKIYLKWMTTFLKMAYYWISFFVLGMIFKIPFQSQFSTFFRIFILFGISIYYVSTVHINQVLGRNNIQTNSLSGNFFYYVFLTFEFIPMFIKQYKKTSGKSPYEKLEIVFRKCYKIGLNKSLKNVSNSNPLSFFSFPNFYLLLFLLFITIILAV